MNNSITVILCVCTGNNEEEAEGKSFGSDKELSLVDKQVETLKREEIMEAKR